MSKIKTTREIDLEALPFPAQQRWDGEEGEIEADVPEADLEAAVADAPEPSRVDVPPLTDDEINRLRDLLASK